MLFKSLGNLDSPFILELGDTQQSDAHDGDDDRGDETEDALPDVLGFAEDVLSEAIECANERPADNNTDQEAGGNAIPDLFEKFLVHLYNEGRSVSEGLH